MSENINNPKTIGALVIGIVVILGIVLFIYRGNGNSGNFPASNVIPKPKPGPPNDPMATIEEAKRRGFKLQGQ